MHFHLFSASVNFYFVSLLEEYFLGLLVTVENRPRLYLAIGLTSTRHDTWWREFVWIAICNTAQLNQTTKPILTEQT